MKRHYIIIDGNSIGHSANSMKPLTIGNMKVHAIFGFLRMIRGYLAKYSFATPIVLWDGLSWRKTAYPEYKANRDKAESKTEIAKQQSNKEYAAQRPYIEKALSFLGVTQVKAQNMEADDLAAILTNLYTSQGHNVTLVTEDQDWLQLIRPNVAVERPVKKDRVMVSNFTEVTGYVSAATFVESKALSGDTGDNIKGIGGVGKARAVELLTEYGSFNKFLSVALLDKSVDIGKFPKWKRDLITDENKALAFAFNISLVDLNTTARPKPKDMMINKGEPSSDNFRKMCDLLLFKSITDIYDDWISVFPVSKTVAQS